MELNFKKSLPYLGGFLGAVVLATVAFVGGMWYKGQMTQPQPQTKPESCEDCIKPLPTPDTSNWRTYRNEELGFEVKYPEGAEIIEPEPLAGCDDLFWFKESSLDKELFTICRIENLLMSDYVYWEGIDIPHFRVAGQNGGRDISHSSAGGKGYEIPLPGMIEYGVDYQGDFWIISFHFTSPELYINWTDTVVSTFRFID